MISASTSSLSKVEFSPSLSEVVTRVWPCSSSHLRRPSSFWVVPRSPGTCESRGQRPCFSKSRPMREGDEWIGAGGKRGNPPTCRRNAEQTPTQPTAVWSLLQLRRAVCSLPRPQCAHRMTGRTPHFDAWCFECLQLEQLHCLAEGG